MGGGVGSRVFSRLAAFGPLSAGWLLGSLRELAAGVGVVAGGVGWIERTVVARRAWWASDGRDAGIR